MPFKSKINKKAWDKKRAEETRQRVLGYLHSHPCVDCGWSDVRALEFDHVRGKKSFCVSKFGTMSFAALQREIAKCDVRCANCHKIRHYELRNGCVRGEME